MAREKAEEALKRSTSIELGFEPWDYSMMDEDLSNEYGLI